MSLFKNSSNNFDAGKISQYISSWRMITADSKILNLVNGYSLELNSTPVQTIIPKPIQFNTAERYVIDEEIKLLLHKKVIEKVTSN